MSNAQSRRLFLSQLGRGTFAVAVLGVGVVACAEDSGDEALQPRTESSTASPTTETPATAAPTTTADEPAAASTTTEVAEAPAAMWQRVNLGFVSAYVVARSGEAAVVDTGVGGSEGEIGAGLSAIGLGWDAVGHVILTHSHGDHVGSVGAVLDAVPEATAYAGAEDIPQITAPRALTPVADGDNVFGLRIVATPGHTPGHISVLDIAGRVLVAGDALNGGDAMGGEAGTVAGANPQFTADIAVADESIRKLALLDVETILFGHGEPVESGAGVMLGELAASL